MTPSDSQPVSTIDLLAFATELALLTSLGVAGARLGDGPVAVGLAILLPVSTMVLWGTFLSPRASRRLPLPHRLVAKHAVTISAATLLALTGSTVEGAAMLVLTPWVMTVAERGGSNRERLSR